MRLGAAWLNCPRCDGQIEVTFKIEEGEKQTWEYPGSPAIARITGENRRSFCECELTHAEWDRMEETGQQRMFDEAYHDEEDYL